MRNYMRMPLQLSRRVARFNQKVTNPIQGTYAWLVPPWAVIIHRGRRSGRTFRTPVDAFVRGDTIAVAILYGEQSDWIRNLLAAGSGQVVRGGRTHPLTDIRVVAVEAAGPEISPRARRFGRVSGKLLVGQLGPSQPGFGRGPAAG